jgi:hypothetical protein
MQHLSPWTAPDAYCQAVNGWTVSVTTPNPLCQGPFPNLACGVTIPKTYTTTYAVWTSDHVFCLSGTTELWLLFLFLAGALWVMFTVLRLFHTFDWRGLSGFSVGDIVKAIGSQVALLVIAISSFSLLLLIHQSNFQVINSLVGDLPANRVDSLWGKLDTLLSASQTATQNLDPNAWTNGLFGGNLPDNSAPFGLTWGQIFGGIGSLESFLLSTLLPVRFAALFVAVVTAPLAILMYGLPYTRRFFWIWFDFWMEVELLATGSALVIAAYQQLHHPLETTQVNLAPTEQAIILLAFAGLVCGANLAFLWKILGSFLANITSFYQQQYQRERQFWGILAQAGFGILGAAATIFTDGAALPLVLAAEGALSGVEEAGAVPASPVPGSGIGRTLLSAGGVSTWRNANTGAAAGGPRSSGPGGGTGGSRGPAAGGGPATGAGGNAPGGAGGGAGTAGGGAPGGLPGPSGRNTAGSPGATGGAPGAFSGAAAGGTLGGGSAARPGHAAQPAPMQAGPSTPAPAGPGTAPGQPAGGGAFSRPGPWWTSPPPVPAPVQAGLQAAQALPAVLDQLPLSSGVQQRLFASWRNSRGEEIDAKDVFRAYFWNETHPDRPLQFRSGQGKDFLSVSTTSGMGTAVSMSSIEYRLRAVPYLQDTVELYKRGWIRAEDMGQTASTLGTLYHALPSRVYPAQMEQVRDFLGGTASARAVDPDHGFAALLQFIGGLTPPQRGGKP